MTLTLRGEEITLLPERAIYWPKAQTLLVADTHWGKAATMRAAAIPVPGGTTSDDLARLTRLLCQTRARRLVLLGDVIHARQGRAPRTLAAVEEWRTRHAALDILMIRGNHDRGAGDPPPALSIRCCNPPVVEAPFVFQHYPTESPDGYTLAGHTHPAVKLHGKGRQRATLPCFHFAARVGVLPAFGSMTGVAVVYPRREDRVFAIAEGEVVEVGAELICRLN